MIYSKRIDNLRYRMVRNSFGLKVWSHLEKWGTHIGFTKDMPPALTPALLNEGSFGAADGFNNRIVLSDSMDDLCLIEILAHEAKHISQYQRSPYLDGLGYLCMFNMANAGLSGYQVTVPPKTFVVPTPRHDLVVRLMQEFDAYQYGLRIRLEIEGRSQPEAAEGGLKLLDEILFANDETLHAILGVQAEYYDMLLSLHNMAFQSHFYGSFLASFNEKKHGWDFPDLKFFRLKDDNSDFNHMMNDDLQGNFFNQGNIDNLREVAEDFIERFYGEMLETLYEKWGIGAEQEIVEFNRVTKTMARPNAFSYRKKYLDASPACHPG